ncbi:unnamed protein product, partial [Brenthis ino]
MDIYTFRVLIGVTGSVATIKLPVLIKSLLDSNLSNQKIIFEISTICTEHSKHFFRKDDLPPKISLYDDASEWDSWKNRGDPVIHIDLGKWADLMVIAPLDANTLAKISQGICDNLLTCTVRAWDSSKPLLFCPAMNTRMWNHPITPKQIGILKECGYEEIPPISKTLMCGDTGVGAMAEVDSIIKRIKEIAEKKYTDKINNTKTV